MSLSKESETARLERLCTVLNMPHLILALSDCSKSKKKTHHFKVQEEPSKLPRFLSSRYFKEDILLFNTCQLGFLNQSSWGGLMISIDCPTPKLEAPGSNAQTQWSFAVQETADLPI